MELFKLFFIGLAYLGVTLFLGRFLLSLIKVNLKYETLNYVTGYLLLESISFLVFVLFGLAGYENFLSSYVPTFFLLIVFAIVQFKANKIVVPFSQKSFRVLWWPSLIVFSVITALYFINAHEQFWAVLHYEGVIYQDIVYHGGIAQSMINFGYPVPDLQYLGKVLHYHLFTHFLTAKISYISFTNPFLTYHVFLNFLGVFFYSFLSVSLIRSLVNTEVYTRKKLNLWLVIISLLCFFCTFFIGGILSYGYIAAFFFSASFQWQLFILITYFMVVRYIMNNNAYSWKNIFILISLLFVATITKVSSLPLLFIGSCSLVVYYMIYQRKNHLKYWMVISFLNGLCGILLYKMFFSGSKSESSLIEFNLELIKSTPVVAFFDFKNPFLILCVYVVTVISFRFLLFWRMNKSETWFSGSILLTGLVLSLLFRNNQVYFLFPAIIIGSHVSLSYFLKLKRKKILVIPMVAFLLFSFYPVGGLGTFINDQLEERKDYYPMNYDRKMLYDWLEENTSKNEVIFTPSVLATPDKMPDNFFPAAMSGRKFYLGGYRFGGLENLPEFPERLKEVKSFDVRDRDLWRKLRKKNINYILIEKKGNFDIRVYKQLDNFKTNEQYESLYQNEYGIILKVLGQS